MRSRLTISIAIALAAVAVVLLYTRNSSDNGEIAQGETGKSSKPSGRLTLTMGEWFFRIDHPRLKAGEVMVTARNVGEIKHDLIALRTNLHHHLMPMTPDGDDLNLDEAGEAVIGEIRGHSESGEMMDDDHAEGDGNADDMMEDGDAEEADTAGNSGSTAMPVAYYGSPQSATVLVDAGEMHDDEDSEMEEESERDDEHMDEEPDGDERGSETVETGHLAPGETRRYEIDLEPGKYVLLCSIPGHYQLGQRASFVVLP